MRKDNDLNVTQYNHQNKELLFYRVSVVTFNVARALKNSSKPLKLAV